MDTPLAIRTIGRHGPPVTRLGLGLAALGRPAYHNLGHGHDLEGRRSPEALEAHCHAVLDAAWAAGVRYVDTARSYGRGEAFLQHWLQARGLARDDVTVGSKWGYTYTGGWRLDAPKHEVKDHSLPQLAAQRVASWELLGPWLSTYSIHSATLESGVLDDDGVLDALAALRDDTGVVLGLTVTGPHQADTLRRALEVRDGTLFGVVQATLNVLEPSVAPALAEAHEAGWGVVVKEGVANGRLTPRDDAPEALVAQARRLGTTEDALGLAWVLDHGFVDVALSGAATEAQLHGNLAALHVALDDEARAALAPLAWEAEAYWSARSRLPWT